jgi:hypothetical protein
VGSHHRQVGQASASIASVMWRYHPW